MLIKLYFFQLYISNSVYIHSGIYTIQKAKLVKGNIFHLYNIVQVLLLNYRLLITIVDGRTHCKRIIFAARRRHTNSRHTQ